MIGYLENKLKSIRGINSLTNGGKKDGRDGKSDCP